MINPSKKTLDKIQRYSPREGIWLDLETLLAELWDIGVTPSALPVLFNVFERYPDEDGSGVFWSIVHGVESLPFDYENELRESLNIKQSHMGSIMLERLEKEKKITNKVRLCSHGEPQSEPFVGQARSYI